MGKSKLKLNIVSLTAAAAILITPVLPVVSMFNVQALSNGSYVTLNAFSGHPAATLTVSGGGFIAHETIAITAVENGVQIASASSTATASGDFSSPLTLPTKLSQGNATITATGKTSTLVATNGYYVSPFTPSLTLGSTSTTPYANLTVSGSGYAANETVDLNFAGATSIAHADATGSFGATTITTPNVPAASYTLVGAGEASGASATSYEYVNGFYASASPTSYYVLPATSLGFNGSGFAANETITVSDADTATVLSTFKADKNGSFTNGGSFIVPANFAGLNKKFVLTGSLSNATTTVSSTIGKYFPSVSPSIYYVLPGNTISFNGSGFIPGETIDVMSGTTKVATAVADTKGNLKLAGTVTVPTNVAGTTQTYTLVGETSMGAGSASVQIGSYSPNATPSSYYAAPGSIVTFSGTGYAPSEIVSIFSGVNTLGSFSTAIDGSFTNAGGININYNQANTTANYVLIGSVSKTPQAISFGVGQLSTQITPSSYYVLPFAPFSVSVAGFAPSETVTLTNGANVIATTTTNKLGVGTFKNVTLAAGAASAKLVATGVTSQATASVSIGIGLYNASVTSSNYYVKPGTVVTLSGTGFAPNEMVSIVAGATSVSVAADSNGVVTTPFTIPFGQKKSTIDVTATGALSMASSTTTLTLAPYTPQVSPSTYYAVPGSSVTFAGSGFVPGESVTVSLNGSQIGTETASKLGAFASATYQLPFGKIADFTFTGVLSSATNDVNVGLAQFYAGLQLSSYYGNGGSVVTATGSGFAPFEPITLFAGTGKVGGTATDKTGAFVDSITIPYTAASQVKITAVGGKSAAVGASGYTVATAYNSVQLKTYAVPAGKAVDFIGSGYFANEPITITTDRTTGSASFYALADGTFNDTSYVLPANLAPGTLTITITGGYSFTTHTITIYVQSADTI